ncbi:very long chain fatty acid elongase 7-like isoform X2 [Dysidea avara]
MSLSFWLNPVNVYEFVRDFYYEKLKVADPRLDSFPLMSSPVPTAILIGLYLLFVLVGPRIMKNRQPVNVKIPMMIYNLSMVILSYYLFHELLFGMLDANFTFLCDPIDYSNNPKALRLVSVCWLYYFSKFIEFTDTVFFILRKKDNQVTILHVYHHSSIAALWWMWAKWGSGGTSCLAPCVNCGIHIVMYSYYFLSGLGPQVQKYLWWKKYITVMQL